MSELPVFIAQTTKEQEIEITREAIELLESEDIDVTDSKVIEMVAFRDGNPLEWDRPELSYEITSRICHLLGMTRTSDAISAAAFREEDRQKTIFGKAQQEKLEREHRHQLEASTERGLGQTATLLVEALVSPDDPRDRDEIRAQVLRALMPIQEQIENHYHYPQVIR